MSVPTYTVDLIRQIEELTPDKIEADPKIVGTPEYWMKVGVIELVRKLKYQIGQSALNDVSAIG